MSDKKSLLEASLFVSARQMSAKELANLAELDSRQVMKLLDDLSGEYEQRGAGLQILKDGRSYIMQVRPEYEEKVLSLAPVAEIPKTVLKTLAIIAHEQPIKQSKLIRMRGNRAYYYIKKLRELEMISAKKSGRTKILTTTAKFKEYFRVDTVKGVVKKPKTEEAEDQHKPTTDEDAPVKETEITFEMK